MSLNLDKSTWKRVFLGDVATASKEKVDPTDGSIDRYVAGEHMDSDDLKIHRWGDIGDVELGPAFHRRFRPGQVLYGSRRTYLRKVAVADFGGVCANTTFVVETKDSDVLLQEFLPFIMTAEPFHAFAIAESKGSVNPYVNWIDIERYEFDLPPLDEQKRLAELLWTMETNRDAEELKSNLLSEVINRYCVDVYERSLQKFPSTTFDQVGELLMGRQKAPKYMTGIGSKPYLRVANVGALRLNFDEVEEMDFNEREIARFRLLPGDILLTEGDIVSAMNVGRPAIYNGDLTECAFQNTLIRFRPHTGADSSYYLALFEGMRLSGVFAGAASTTTVTHLGLGRLSAVPLPAAPITYQKVVGGGLRKLLNAREASNAAVTALSALRITTSIDIFGGSQ